MKRWSVNGEPPADVLDEVASVLNQGGIALLPTDTIYGLHSGATNQQALARLIALKERPADKAFVIIAASIEQLESLGATVPQNLRDIWPAPLTAILVSGTATIAARIPDLSWLRSLLDRTGPLASTSANRSGQEPVTAPDLLDPAMQEGIDCVLDSGRHEGKPSTIVDFTGSVPRLVREGEEGFSQILRKTLWKDL